MSDTKLTAFVFEIEYKQNENHQWVEHIDTIAVVGDDLDFADQWIRSQYDKKALIKNLLITLKSEALVAAIIRTESLMSLMD